MCGVSRLSGTRPRKKDIFSLAMQGISGAVAPGRWQKTSSLHVTITAMLLIPSCAKGHHHFQGAFLFPVPLKSGLETCSLIKRSDRELAVPLLCRGGTCPTSMGQLAEEIEAEHEPPAEPDFYHSLSFSAEAPSLFSDETNTICSFRGWACSLEEKSGAMNFAVKRNHLSTHLTDLAFFWQSLFFFFKSWTKTHEKKIHSLNLQAYELLSSDKTKEINVQPGSNSISSYTVTPSLNLIHRTEENKQINSKKVKQPKKVRGVEWETQSVVSFMSWTSHRPEPWTHNVSTDIFHYNRGISKHWELWQLSLILPIQPPLGAKGDQFHC